MHERTQIKLRAADRAELEAVVADRNSPQKHVWRAKIVLLTAAGHGTAEIKRQTGKAKTVIWRWQERFTDEGVDGLWRDKTRPARIPPLSARSSESGAPMVCSPTGCASSSSRTIPSRELLVLAVFLRHGRLRQSKQALRFGGARARQGTVAKLDVSVRPQRNPGTRGVEAERVLVDAPLHGIEAEQRPVSAGRRKV